MAVTVTFNIITKIIDLKGANNDFYKKQKNPF